MQKDFPLGPLAYAVIEQYGDLAETAVTDAVRWRQVANGCTDDGACAISGRLFADEELANQPLQPGNWLSIGLVGDGVDQTVIEINLTDGRTREKAWPGKPRDAVTAGMSERTVGHSGIGPTWELRPIAPAVGPE